MGKEQFTCYGCHKLCDYENKGGNYYYERYCKECWKKAKKYIGKSWGGEVEDKDYNYD